MVGGLALVATGALLLALAPDRAAYASGVLPGFVVLGLGMGLAFPAVSITAMTDVTHGLAGSASGLMSTAHEVGSALGVAALTAIALGAGPQGTVGYGSGTLAAAIVAAVLMVLAAAVVPVVRPAPGEHVPVH